MSISSLTQARLKRDNPRQLKGKRYKKLHDDLKEFGDLSGVVYNVTTGQTIGGNQRSAVFDIGECTFEYTHESVEPDEQGTLKLGYVIWRGNRYGYREVAWPKEREDAACLIANIGAGEWDWERLAAYDSEILGIAGMDADMLKTLENDERNLRAMLEAANEQDSDEDDKYTNKVTTPIYEIKGERPELSTLYKPERYKALINDIDASPISDDVKEFLRIAATRHIVFDFSKIAEYYAHADKSTQKLMEDNALVIIDFNRAIELGYVRLSEKIAEQFSKEYHSG